MNTDRSISTKEITLTELVRTLSKDELLVPSFQREFVWEPNEIIHLWDSIFRFYPIGSLLCWETDLCLNLQRRVGGHIHTGNDNGGKRNDFRRYLLDGQQRATSIVISILGGEGWVYDRPETCLAHPLYFDAVSATFFFGNELKRRRRNVNPIYLIGLEEIFNRPFGVRQRVEKEAGREESVLFHIDQLKRVFDEYKIPVIWIRGFDIPAVRDIFMRINQEGRDLKSMDIMIAKTFRDYEYLVEEDL
jgi:hypothetical protein